MGSKYQNSNIDITNQRFGRLIALKKIGAASWLFQCDCGNVITMPYSQLQTQKSCGCWFKERKKEFGENARKHGGHGTALYRRYCQIKQRCYNQNHKSFHRYGGRGIIMCEEWKNSFEAFRKWAYEHGYSDDFGKDNWSIDRIDNDGNYSPQNCRFSTPIEQSLNRENTVICEYEGKRYSAWNFAKEFGITSPCFVYKRLKAGILPEDILSEWKKTKELPTYLITVEEVAKELGKTEGTIRRMLREGKLQGERVNWKWYVVKDQK